MNNSDERDYAEEEYNRRTMEEEGRSELRAESHEQANSQDVVIFVQTGQYLTFVWYVKELGGIPISGALDDLNGNYINLTTEAYFTRDLANQRILEYMNIMDSIGESYYLVDLDKI